MKIIIDAFGGDNAPLAVISGAAQAVKEYGVEILLCGDTEIIKAVAAENNVSLNGIELLHADGVMDMHDEPNTILKSNKNTSIAVAFRALQEHRGDALVSAGSTGAVLFGATFITKRIKGIKRPALAPVLPTVGKPYILVDCGANVDCRALMLYQFAHLGSVYMRQVLGVKNPKVGLLNNGTEDTKGAALQVETYQLLKKSKLNFIGNVEARDIPDGICDVVVTDGFVGNVVLKLNEGIAMSFVGMLKAMLMKNIFTKLAALLLKPSLRDFKKALDYTEYGGAPLLGVNKPVIKAHGSSNAKAIKSAIYQATLCAGNNLVSEIVKSLEEDEINENA